MLCVTLFSKKKGFRPLLESHATANDESRQDKSGLSVRFIGQPVFARTENRANATDAVPVVWSAPMQATCRFAVSRRIFRRNGLRRCTRTEL